MKRLLAINLMLLVSITLLSGCSSQEQALKEQLEAQNEVINKLEVESQSLKEWLRASDDSAKKAQLIYCAADVMVLLKQKNFEQLATNYIDNKKGLRFSAYQFIDADNDVKLTADQVKGLLTDGTTREWGSFDGSGEPISMTFDAYYKTFVYDKDFVKPNKIGYNEFISSGNTSNNLKEVYPNSEFVEFLLEGTEEFAGMDWSSVRLVFEQKEGAWKLVGIIHGQWTI